MNIFRIPANLSTKSGIPHPAAIDRVVTPLSRFIGSRRGSFRENQNHSATTGLSPNLPPHGPGFYRETASPGIVKLSVPLDEVLILYSRKLPAENISVAKQYRGELGIYG
jgi:hypothetical protein